MAKLLAGGGRGVAARRAEEGEGQGPGRHGGTCSQLAT